VAVAIITSYVASVDTVSFLKHVWTYSSLGLQEREKFRTENTTQVVEAIDGYLLAAVMIIFAFGLYELFISKINRVGREDRGRVLVIHSLDDLKHRLGQLVLLILVVKFFERGLAIAEDLKTGSDLLLFSGGIVLVAVALYLTHKKEQVESKGG